MNTDGRQWDINNLAWRMMPSAAPFIPPDPSSATAPPPPPATASPEAAIALLNAALQLPGYALGVVLLRVSDARTLQMISCVGLALISLAPPLLRRLPSTPHVGLLRLIIDLLILTLYNAGPNTTTYVLAATSAPADAPATYAGIAAAAGKAGAVVGITLLQWVVPPPLVVHALPRGHAWGLSAGLSTGLSTGLSAATGASGGDGVGGGGGGGGSGADGADKMMAGSTSAMMMDDLHVWLSAALGCAAFAVAAIVTATAHRPHGGGSRYGSISSNALADAALGCGYAGGSAAVFNPMHTSLCAQIRSSHLYIERSRVLLIRRLGAGSQPS